MTVSRRARAFGNLGSLGASHQKVPLAPGEVMPKIRIMSASITYGQKETPIWNNGKWLGKKFPARKDEDCLFRLRVSGAGKAIVSAVFNDSDDNPCYLFVRRVGPGEHFISVQIPFRELPKFRFAIGGKVDTTIDGRFLSNKEKKGLSSNMLLLNETKNAYYTESLGGYSGLGSGHSGMSDDYHPSFVKQAYITPKKTMSGLNTIWSGSLSKHRWKTHGFSGLDERRNRKADNDPGFWDPSAKTQKARQDAVEGPLFVADKSGFYAFRGSTYQMRYDEKGTMLGYDAMEKLSRGMPAGIPICMVMQYFVHDQVNPGLSSFAGGPYDNLGWGVLKKAWKGTKKAASWTADKTVAVVEDVGDRTIDTYEAGKNFANDPSWANATSIITAPLGGNSCWHYADDVKIPGSRLFFVEDNVFYGYSDTDTFDRPSNRDGLFTSYGEASAIPYIVNKSATIKSSFKHKNKTYNKKRFGMKVEWYNPSTKKWSTPMVSPPFNFTTDSKGKIKVVFRFPRQLDPNSDASEIAKGIRNGYPDYSYDRNTIKSAYPYLDTTGNKIAYSLLGRIENKDSKTEERVGFTQTIGGISFRGRRSISAILYCDPPSHWRSGMTHPSGVGSMDTGQAFAVRIADPAKFTYLDNPEVDNSYYVQGDMKPGSTVVIIGKALGTVNSNNTILTTRGWANGVPAETIGRKEPPGDTPAFVSVNVIRPNSQKPRTERGKEGTNRADFLELVGHITTNDLIDKISVPGEEVLKTTWKNIFGVDLDVAWFNKMKLPGHDPTNPAKYLIKGSMGETYSFPFSISWFQLPPYYTGPYLDYNEQGQLQQIEGRPYAIFDPASPDQQLNIISRTPFGKLMQQKFDVVAETQEQKFLIEEGGYTPDEALAINEMNYDAEDMTEIADLDARERDFLEQTGQTHPMDKDPRMIRYTNDWFKANYKFGNKDVVLKPEVQPPVIAGFSNQGNFYVEDVTEKWGTLNGAAYTNDDFDVNMMPLPMPEDEDDTPFIGFAGLSGWDDAIEQAGNVGKVVGRASAEFGKEQVKAIADLDPDEMVAFGALGLGAALTMVGLGYAAFYGVPKGLLSGVAEIRRAGGRNKADKIRAKADARDTTGGIFGRLTRKPASTR